MHAVGHPLCIFLPQFAWPGSPAVSSYPFLVFTVLKPRFLIADCEIILGEGRTMSDSEDDSNPEVLIKVSRQV
jgi:hypothetical protein